MCSFLSLQRHLMALLKFAPVESWLCSCKRRGKATFDTPINPCARSACSRSVAVGLYDTLGSLEMMPYRECSTPDDFKAALQGIDQLLIDATARAYRRSQDEAKQREHYSGKKRAYAEEHGDVPPQQVH